MSSEIVIRNLQACEIVVRDPGTGGLEDWAVLGAMGADGGGCSTIAASADAEGMLSLRRI